MKAVMPNFDNAVTASPYTWGEPPSLIVVEFAVPRSVYDRLDVPVTAMGTSQWDLDSMPNSGHVRLIIGEGCLGLEWLKGVELAE
jgi:hypothetical protein